MFRTSVEYIHFPDIISI